VPALTTAAALASLYRGFMIQGLPSPNQLQIVIDSILSLGLLSLVAFGVF
jgi:hypothetical protein